MGGTQSLVETSETYCDGFVVDRIRYDWTVRNFKKFLTYKVGYSICSNSMSINAENDTETFKLVLYPNGFNERVKGYVSLWLKKTSTKEKLIFFTCTVVDAEDCQVIQKSTKQILSIESFLGWKTFCPINVLSGEDSSALTDGGLTLKCTVSIFRDKVLTNPEIEDSDPYMNTSLSDLSCNFSCLLFNPDYHDFTIQVEDKKLPAHKVILSARSPVFKVLLKSPLTNRNEMEITDITEPIVREMLNFIYTGKVSYLSVQAASNLYYAADKYELNSLKNICCKVIKKHFEVNNVLSALLLSERHSDVELKELCIQYIVKNASEVQEQKEWMELLKSHPQIANVLFKRLASRSDSK